MAALVALHAPEPATPTEPVAPADPNTLPELYVSSLASRRAAFAWSLAPSAGAGARLTFVAAF